MAPDAIYYYIYVSVKLFRLSMHVELKYIKTIFTFFVMFKKNVPQLCLKNFSRKVPVPEILVQ